MEIAAPFIEASGPASFCAGGDVVLYTSTGTGTGITYQWQKDSVNIAGATSSSYVVNTSGYYSCFVTSTASCFSATNAIYIDVHPTPMPVVSYDGYHVSTSPYYATYQWYINMVAIPGATTYETVANEIGSYRVMVTDTNACGNTSNGYGIYELGVNNVNPSAPAYIYPNPANDVLHIAAKQDVRAVITGIDGKMILEQAHAADMDISSLPSGLYLVALYGDDGNRVLIQKLVKE